MLGQGDEQFRCRKGNMQEEADAVGDAELAQFGRQGNEMIVMDPDEVVRQQQWLQALREPAVDAQVTLEGGAPVEREPRPVVKQRPQRAVGVSDVEFPVVGCIDVDGRIGDLAGRMQPRRARGTLRGFPTPAEPETAAPRERRCR